MSRAALALLLTLVPARAFAQAPARTSSTSDSTSSCQVASTVPMHFVDAGPGHAAGTKLYTGSVDVTLDCGKVKLFADEFWYYDDEDIVHVRGNVVFQQESISIYADRADINKKTRNGTFYDAHGTTRNTEKKSDKDVFGGAEPDYMFWAEEISRTGPDRFEMRHGEMTACVQATPRWSLSGSSGSVVHNKRVMFWNAVLRVKGVPVFYIPFIYYPVNKEGRSTGFLTPSLGRSSVGGFQISNAFFWAIDRSQDATFYNDFLKRAGTGYGAEYRFASSPSTSGNAQLYLFRQKANALQTAGRSYTLRGQFNSSIWHGYNLVGQANYFSDARTQQLYQQSYFDTTTTRFMSAAITGGHGRYRISGSFARNDVFVNTTSASRNGYAPRLTLSFAEAPIGRSRLYFGVTGEGAYLLNQSNIADASTNHSLARFDATPTVRWPMSTLSFLSVTTSASWRLTEWLESVDPTTQVQRSSPIFRQLFNVQTRVVGPVFARVWQPKTGKFDRLKHLISPNLSIQWYSPFNNRSQIVQTDGVDSVVGGTTTTTYGVTNSFLTRPRAAAGSTTPGPVREVLSVDITQSHYTNALAAAVDAQFGQPCSTGAFSAIQMTVTGRPNDRVSGQFRTDINAHFRTPCTFNASSSLNFKDAQLSLGWTKKQYIPGLVNFDKPEFADHFVNLSTSFKRPDGRLGGTYSLNYDVHHAILVQQNVVFFYNSQCCGLSVQYMTRDLSNLGVKANHQFGISFSLAGIGSFSNPLGSFK